MATRKPARKKSTTRKPVANRKATRKTVAGKTSAAGKPKARKTGSKKAAAVKKNSQKRATTGKTLTKKSTTARKTAAKAPGRSTGGKDTTKRKPVKRVRRKAVSTASPGALAQEQTRPVYSYSSDIPEKYGATCLRALPRDPQWMFLYWEIGDESLREAEVALGSNSLKASTLMLRLLDVTDIGPGETGIVAQADTEITPYANNWYLKVMQPGRIYVVEYGLLTPEDVFHVVATSNTVAMPSGRASNGMGPAWMTEAPSDVHESTDSKDRFIQTSLFEGSSDRLYRESSPGN